MAHVVPSHRSYSTASAAPSTVEARARQRDLASLLSPLAPHITPAHTRLLTARTPRPRQYPFELVVSQENSAPTPPEKKTNPRPRPVQPSPPRPRQATLTSDRRLSYYTHPIRAQQQGTPWHSSELLASQVGGMARTLSPHPARDNNNASARRTLLIRPRRQSS